MENASKALIIAGSVLIALVVISLLVMFYDNITETMNAKEKVDMTEQIVEFNKQYDVYYRNNLYGSDILSLSNKVKDYNEREAGAEGYQKLNMTVEFTSKTSIRQDGKDLTTVIYKGDVWNSSTLQDLIENETTGWNSIISNMEKTITIYSKAYDKDYTIQYLSGLRQNELKEIFKEEISKKAKYIEENVQPEINKYLSYKSALATLKSKSFKATNFEYDKKTGRIILMKFKEN